jgi:hypothetical protein
MWLISKDNRSLKDDKEEEILLAAEANEVMPTSLAKFKNQ